MAPHDHLPISLFTLLREHFGTTLQPLRCTKATLVHLSHTLEDIVLSRRLPALLFTGFQESSHWREETERYRALASIAQQVCIFAGGALPPESSARELHVTLTGDDPLRQEWFLAILSPQFSVLLCGQDRQVDAASEATRQFDTLWSFEPAVVDRVLDALEEVVASYRPERLEALRAARRAYPPAAPDPALVTHFTSELIRFEENIHQQLVAVSRRLQQQIRWREDLLATMVHDLRSPLQGILLALDMLRVPGLIGAVEADSILERGQSAAQQMAEIIQLILETNQLDDGQLPLTISRIDPGPWAAEALAPCLTAAEQQSISLDVRVQAPILWADKGLLSRALQNLVGNAIKFTPSGGQVQVAVAPAPQPGQLEIRVRDTGRGISPEALPRIFERYHQGDDKDRRGYGLGLYFCRLVAEAHHGSIRAASQLGAGTTFTLTLPVQPLVLSGAPAGPGA